MISQRIHIPTFPAAQQRGVVLIVALVMLLLLTIIGVTAMTTNTLEERMTGNLKDKNTSLQAGEAGLREAETVVLQLPPPIGRGPQASLYPDLSQQTNAWWQTNGTEFGTGGATDLYGVGNDPRYVVELISITPDSKESSESGGVAFYRVTARGTGGSDDTQSIVQITVRKRFN